MGQKLSPYWQRLGKEAEKILEEQIDSLRKRTVDPEYCLDKKDSARMAFNQLELAGAKDILSRVRKGDFAGKLWALDTVMGRNPLKVFKP